MVKLLFNLRQVFSRLVRIEVQNLTNQSEVRIRNSEVKVVCILVNLIENSLKFNARKGMTISVLLKAECVKLEVRYWECDLSVCRRLVECYESSAQEERRVQVRNQMVFDHFVRMESKLGWLVSRVLIAQVGPSNRMKIAEGVIKVKVYRRSS